MTSVWPKNLLFPALELLLVPMIQYSFRLKKSALELKKVLLKIPRLHFALDFRYFRVD